MDVCANHAEHEAIERCEVCGRPLCALCLWYTADGHRLCQEHAQEAQAAGSAVNPPSDYAEAISASLKPAASESGPAAPYQGNRHDLLALVAALVGGTSLASCFGGVYCLPLVAAILAGYAYQRANEARDPRRTRMLAAIGLGTGGLIAFFILAIVTFWIIYMAAVVFMVATSTRP